MLYLLWGLLVLMAVMGISLGLFYYFKAEYVVDRRVKRMNFPLHDNDPEFRKWFKKEYETQVNRTRKVGKMLFIIEVIWLIIILALFISGSGTLTK